jgi:HD-GYP domain-containing protein (c-di-GMP phosphodiesterase class II)
MNEPAGSKPSSAARRAGQTLAEAVAAATGRSRRGRPWPLSAWLMSFVTLLVLLLGGAVGGYQYLRATQLALQSAAQQFDSASQQVQTALQAALRPVQGITALALTRSVADAEGSAERLSHVPLLLTALNAEASVAAIYVGYRDGGFIQVRRLSTQAQRETLGAPAWARYVVMSNQTGGNAPGQGGLYIDLDESGEELARREQPTYRFDPRPRPWYKLAEAAGPGELVQTPPYLFFSTREPGITAALRDARGKAVIGLDLTLAGLSELLDAQALSLSSRAALLDARGRVLATSGGRLPLAGSGADAEAQLDLISVGAIASEVLRVDPGRLAALTAAGVESVADLEGRTWLRRVADVGSRGQPPLYLVAAAPRDEVIGAALALRRDGLLATVGVALLLLPLAWWWTRRTARKLRALTDATRRMADFRFDGAVGAGSRIAEVDELARAMTRLALTIERFMQLARALASERDFDRLCDRVLRETMLAAGMQGGRLYLKDGEGGKLVPIAERWDVAESRQATPDELHPDTVVLTRDGQRAPAIAVLERRTTTATLPLSDMSLDPALVRAARALDAAHVLQICLPLASHEGEPTGVLELFLAQPQGAGAAQAADQIAFAEALSGTAAITLENQQLLAGQKALMESFIQLVAQAIDAKSAYTGGHCSRVPELTKMLAQAAVDTREGPYADFSLTPEQWEELHIAGWLHDCGKLTTPEYVIDKATKLETIYDRIHEVRMRFEVLKREAEIAALRARLGPAADDAALRAAIEAEWRTLDDEFAFVAQCNLGGESMRAEDVERLRAIGARRWTRTLSDRIGIAHEEAERKARTPEPTLPVSEPLLADKPEHIVPRTDAARYAEGNRWGFKLEPPEHLFNRGELYNLSVRRGTLTEEDRFVINGHMVQTIVMLDRLPFPRHLKNVPEIAGGHHEKMDGTGYPKRLRGEDMSAPARMMAIADVFEALTAQDRPYKKGKTLSESLAIMRRMVADRHLDPELFAVFVRQRVYLRYAERYMKPEQIDAVDEEALLAAPPPAR